MAVGSFDGGLVPANVLSGGSALVETLEHHGKDDAFVLLFGR